MKCLLAQPNHGLSLALARAAEPRGDIDLTALPDDDASCERVMLERAPQALIVPPMSDPGRAEPAEVYRHCERVERWLGLCAAHNVALIWCVSDTLFEEGADTAIDEACMPTPRDETLRRLLETGERVRHHPRHMVLRLGPLFAIDGDDAWLGTLIASLMRGETVRMPQDLILCPTSAPAVARALIGVLMQLDAGADAWGTYHLSGIEPVSAYTFVSVVRTHLATRLEGVGQPAELGPLLALNQHHDTPLRRVLDCQRMLDVFGIHQKSWRLELGLMLDAWCQLHYGSQEEATDA